MGSSCSIRMRRWVCYNLSQISRLKPSPGENYIHASTYDARALQEAPKMESEEGRSERNEIHPQGKFYWAVRILNLTPYPIERISGRLFDFESSAFPGAFPKSLNSSGLSCVNSYHQLSDFQVMYLAPKFDFTAARTMLETEGEGDYHHTFESKDEDCSPQLVEADDEDEDYHISPPSQVRSFFRRNPARQ